MSRLPSQVGLQAMLHDLVGSLAGLPAWTRPQAAFSNVSKPGFVAGWYHSLDSEVVQDHSSAP